MDLPSFDAICLSQVLHVSVYEWGSIVTNQSLGGPEPCDDVLPNEVCHNCSSGLFKGITSTHFVKYSVVARIHIWPLEGGFMGPIRSSPKVWKGHSVVISCSTFG